MRRIKKSRMMAAILHARERRLLKRAAVFYCAVIGGNRRIVAVMRDYIRDNTFLYGIKNTKNLISSWNDDEKRSPDSAFWVSISKDICTPINKIFTEMTYEQIRSIAEWLTRNANKITDEGKRLNKAYEHQEKFMKENDMEEIDRLLHS